MMIDAVKSINVWLSDILDTVPIVPDIRPYVLRTLTRPDFCSLERNSIVIAMTSAETIEDLRNIGDFAFWKSSFAQEYPHQEVVEAIGMMSYYECYKMSGRRVLAFELLSDELPFLTKQIHLRMSTKLTTSVAVDT